MADVFLAVMRGPVGFQKLVVIKRLRPNLAEDPEFLGMLLDEARLAARLNHPNVVQTYEVGEGDGQHFIAMEYLEGQSLDSIIEPAGVSHQLPLEMGLKIVSDALAGLHYAHELADYDGRPLGVVHRDPSPQNIFVTYAGQTKLVDFGIAKAATRTVETLTGVLKGKIAYMSPEQAACEEVDRRADVFSVGVLLWELATGRRLWQGLNDMEILKRLVAGAIPRVRSARPDAPWRLDAICARALARSREDRYPTAAELRGEIDRYLEQSCPGVTHEDIAHAVTTLFHQHRARMASIIERHLAPGVPTSGARKRPSKPRSVDEPLIPHRASVPPAPDPPGEPTALTEQTPLSSADALEPPFAPPPRTRRARRRIAATVTGALVVGALCGGIVFVRRPHGEPSAAGPAPEDSAAASASSVPSAARSTRTGVQVRISATPSEAKLYLDEQPLPANPFVAELDSDSAEHQIRAEAPGYVAQTRTSRFDQHVTLELGLEPISPPKKLKSTPKRAPGPPEKRKLDAWKP